MFSIRICLELVLFWFFLIIFLPLSQKEKRKKKKKVEEGPILYVFFFFFNLDKLVLKTWISRRVSYFVGILSVAGDKFLPGCP